MFSVPVQIHVGNNNFVNAHSILTIASGNAISIKRMVKDAQAHGVLLDYTGALKTRGVILTEGGIVIKIPLRPMDIQRAVKEALLDLTTQQQSS